MPVFLFCILANGRYTIFNQTHQMLQLDANIFAMSRS